MNHTMPLLQIRIHRVDRSVSTFLQDDFGIAKQILDTFEPMQIFSRPYLVLADSGSYTSFPVSQITRIDLDSEEDSDLIIDGGWVEAVELNRDEFEALIQNLALRDQWKHLGELDAFVVTFLDVEMTDGQRVLLTMEVEAESPQGLDELRDFLLSRPGLCFRTSSGGVALLNLAHLARLTFFPGAPQPLADAWNVRLLDPVLPGDPAAHPMVLVPANPLATPRKLSIVKNHKWDSK